MRPKTTSGRLLRNDRLQLAKTPLFTMFLKGAFAKTPLFTMFLKVPKPNFPSKCTKTSLFTMFSSLPKNLSCMGTGSAFKLPELLGEAPTKTSTRTCALSARHVVIGRAARDLDHVPRDKDDRLPIAKTIISHVFEGCLCENLIIYSVFEGSIHAKLWRCISKST